METPGRHTHPRIPARSAALPGCRNPANDCGLRVRYEYGSKSHVETCSDTRAGQNTLRSSTIALEGSLRRPVRQAPARRALKRRTGRRIQPEKRQSAETNSCGRSDRKEMNGYHARIRSTASPARQPARQQQESESEVGRERRSSSETGKKCSSKIEALQT